mgnify:CR=1 FL=1
MRRSVSSPPGTRQCSAGPSEDDCTPPATTARSIPARTVAAAVPTVVRLLAQCRFTACPGTCVIPAATAA